ncbi:hypothetical protein K1719_041195 [Acacia pycnantha]|nr:hypothetical protein K1719_041195 [Acacia pycnantha]
MPIKKLKLWDLLKFENVWSDHSQRNVSFPSLRSIDVYDCESLTSIFHASMAKGMLGDLEELEISHCSIYRQTLEWPYLLRLSIENYDELETFEKEVSSLSDIYEEESTLNSKYPLFSQDKVIHNLEDLKLESKPAEMIGSDQFPMDHFPKVKLLCLYAKNATSIFLQNFV